MKWNERFCSWDEIFLLFFSSVIVETSQRSAKFVAKIFSSSPNYARVCVCALKFWNTLSRLYIILDSLHYCNNKFVAVDTRSIDLLHRKTPTHYITGEYFQNFFSPLTSCAFVCVCEICTSKNASNALEALDFRITYTHIHCTALQI